MQPSYDSGDESPDADAQAAPAQLPRGVALRWLGLVALLVVEYLWLSVTFDASPLLLRAGLSAAFGMVGMAAPLFVVVAASVYLLAGERLGRDARALLLHHGARAPLWLCVPLNAAGYASLFLITRTMLSAPELQDGLPLSWIAGWLGSLLLTVFALLPAALPWHAIVPLLRRTFGVLTLGALAGVVAWLAGIASGQLFWGMRVLTLQSVYWLIAPFAGSTIIYQPEDATIGANGFFVEVAPVCSGFEGIGLICVFTLMYLASARQQLRFPRAFLLLPIAIVLVWVGNAVRIALLIGIGALFSPAIALSGFHSKAGWLFFVVVALSMIAFAQRSKFLARVVPGAPVVPVPADVAPSANAGDLWNPTATYLMPLLALIASLMVTGLLSAGFDRLYVLRVLAVAFALYVNRKHLPKPSWPPHALPVVLGVVTFGLWLLVIPRPAADSVATFRAGLADMPEAERFFWLLARTFGSTVTVPIAEELGFRAFLLRRLVSADFVEVPKTRFAPVALLASSLAFGAMHGSQWIGGTIAGVIYALAQKARGRTGDAIVAHAVTNALIAFDVLMLGADWLWV